jgi:hypothetical protein
MMYLEDDPPQFKVWLHVNPVRFAAHRQPLTATPVDLRRCKAMGRTWAVLIAGSCARSSKNTCVSLCVVCVCVRVCVCVLVYHDITARVGQRSHKQPPQPRVP